MKSAVIITNAFASSQGQNRQVSRYTQEMNKLGISVTHITALSCGYLDGNAVAQIPKCDFVLFLDKDRHIAELLEKAGYRLFNSAHSMWVSDDKMETYLHLLNNGLVMPKTISSPLNYTAGNLGEDFLREVEKKIPYPIVVKKCHGSFGSQVYLANSFDELCELYVALRYEPMLFQQFISCSSGTDTRVIVVGGKVIAAMKRVNEQDFRSNIELGAKGYPVQLSNEFRLVAEKSAKLLKLDYCGIDLLTGANGEPILCEVNSNAYFHGIEQVTGINVAAAYVQHIYRTVYGEEKGNSE